VLRPDARFIQTHICVARPTDCNGQSGTVKFRAG
jgi:hypothetical protein